MKLEMGLDAIFETRIFTESNEDIGILYKGYKPLYQVITSFLDLLESNAKKIVKSPENIEIDLKSEIEQFKKDIDKEFTPEAIEISKIHSIISDVKKFRSDCETDILSKFAKIKKDLAFGGNYFRAIINRPKVYLKDADEGSYSKVNASLRNINRAMDWVEKIIIDLFNMISQDLSILAYIDRVYGKSHIYEYSDDTDIYAEGLDIGGARVGNVVESVDHITEDVGDADDMKPESDHPIRDALMDIDRKTTTMQQNAKHRVQNAQNVVKAAVKPVDRTMKWVGKMAQDWKDKDENELKEKLADPKARNNVFHAIKVAIKYGSLAKAGLLFNPIFLFLSVTKKVGNNKRIQRMRNEMIGEIKTEMEVLDVKIQDAAAAGDNKAKYQMMRFKNELHKKLLRVSGGNKVAKMI